MLVSLGSVLTPAQGGNRHAKTAESNRQHRDNKRQRDQ
jgi:hypothetical protein